jgi:AmmeMemoRadiSam system protein A
VGEPAAQPPSPEWTPQEQEALLRLARQAVEAKVREGRDLTVPAEVAVRFPRIMAPRGAFVTLKKHGALRGCIGSLAPTRPLAQDVVENAIHAAVHDTRFSPVREPELASITLSISVLDVPRPLEGLNGEAVAAHLAKVKPGLVLTHQGRRSTFLPEVWEELPDVHDFLGHLCRKQGAPAACWRDAETQFETYGSFHMAEPPR